MRNTYLLLASIAFSLVMIELGLRLASGTYYAIAVYNLEGKPRLFQPMRPSSSGDNEIMLLGDSFTYGSGTINNETYPGFLQEMIPGSTIINYGVPGYNIGDVYELYLNHSSKPFIYGYFENDAELSSYNMVKHCGLTPEAAFFHEVFGSMKLPYFVHQRTINLLFRLNIPSDDRTTVYLEHINSEESLEGYCVRKVLRKFNPEHGVFFHLPSYPIYHFRFYDELGSEAEDAGFRVFDMPKYFESRDPHLSPSEMLTEDLHYGARGNLIIAQGVHEFLINNSFS
ncbi:MAG: SGNH/GDSL hydrolase family protein [Nanoarchaeota archaeon]|nr:SGNH/GDSL hydrolase family protein [Nanoarchaeota archaeon]